ncbi:MAG: prephenate dehydratase [Acidobacteria bacterium]|nr:prephenate dehydratase [Acidobacteriota bacterium]
MAEGPVAAYQGEPGSYSEMALLEFFRGQVRPVPRATFDEVFEQVSRGDAGYGIVPIENSLAGSIHRNYDLLLRHELTILGEHHLKVEHYLIGHPGVDLGQIRKVYSHPQALAQCEQYLARLGALEIIPTYDTAGSVKYIKEHGIREGAAVASRRAAEIYQMKILAEGIEDQLQNYTRFLILARENPRPQEGNKTSIVFSVENRPGSLFRALSAFALRDIDLYKIESRPLQGKPWEYFFYLDFQGNPAEPNCRNALSHLGEMTTFLKVLGSYPRATL